MNLTWNSPWMRTTGIPPHVELYHQHEKTREAVNKLQSVSMDRMAQLMEEKGVNAGNITKDVLHVTIRDALLEAGIRRGEVEPLQVDADSSPQRQLHVWGN
jgi:hypothetical protein